VHVGPDESFVAGLLKFFEGLLLVFRLSRGGDAAAGIRERGSCYGERKRGEKAATAQRVLLDCRVFIEFIARGNGLVPGLSISE
jgi:hypothetical protein